MLLLITFKRVYGFSRVTMLFLLLEAGNVKINSIPENLILFLTSTMEALVLNINYNSLHEHKDLTPISLCVLVHIVELE